MHVVYLCVNVPHRKYHHQSVYITPEVIDSNPWFTHRPVQHMFNFPTQIPINTDFATIDIPIFIKIHFVIHSHTQWFPKHKGRVNGIVMSGFGGGSLIFNHVETAYINPLNLSPNTSISSDLEDK